MVLFSAAPAVLAALLVRPGRVAMVATTPATASAIQPLEAARSAHAAEVLRSAGNWSCAEPPAPRAFSDGDFASWSVRAGFAGPDEALLRGGHRIHATRDAVADAARVVRERMERLPLRGADGFGDLPPLPVSVVAGPSWGEMVAVE